MAASHQPLAKPDLRPVISAGQAMLLLLNFYRNDPKKTYIIKQLYLFGAQTEAIRALLEEFKKDPLLADYQISEDSHVINEDCSRRYFETHFAYEMFKNAVNDVDLIKLSNQFNQLWDLFPKECQNELKVVLEGTYTLEKAAVKDKIAAEYSYIIRNIKLLPAEQFSVKNKNKLLLLIKFAFLVTAINKLVDLPLEHLYLTGFFEDKSRGRIDKHRVSLSVHKGILKSYMPMPYADDASDSTSIYPFDKPADRLNFEKKADWCSQNFATAMNPFVTSISGSILLNLRCFLYLDLNQTFHFRALKDFIPYIRTHIGVLMYFMGSHSLYEFSATFDVFNQNEDLDFIENGSTLNSKTLYYDGNEKALNKALEKTLKYNDKILERQKLLAEIKQKIQRVKPIKQTFKKKLPQVSPPANQLFAQRLKQEEKPVAPRVLGPLMVTNEQQNRVMLFKPHAKRPEPTGAKNILRAAREMVGKI